MKYHFSIGERVFSISNIVFLSLLAVITIYPLWYLAVISFNTGFDSARGGIYFWPRKPTLENILMIIKWDMFRSSLLISIERVLLFVPFHLLVTSMAAYAMSRRNFIGRQFLVFYMLVTMLFSGGLIPYYIVLNKIGLLDRFLVYIIPGLFSVWDMIVMRTAMREVPDSLIESAMIDGASDFKIYWRVVLPLVKPMLATLALFAAVGQWNDWFSGAFFVTNKNLVPLQTFVQYMLQRGGADDLIAQAARAQMEKMTAGSNLNTFTANSLKYTAVLLACLPIVAVYPFLQKFFVKGVMIGSIKE